MSMSVIIIAQGAGAEGVRPRCVHDKKEHRDVALSCHGAKRYSKQNLMCAETIINKIMIRQ